MPWCSRILISIWAFLQLRAFRWWQNNLFARSLRSRSDFLTQARSCLLLDGWKLWVGTFMCPAAPLDTFLKWISEGFLDLLFLWLYPAIYCGHMSILLWVGTFIYISPGSINPLSEVNILPCFWTSCSSQTYNMGLLLVCENLHPTCPSFLKRTSSTVWFLDLMFYAGAFHGPGILID